MEQERREWPETELGSETPRSVRLQVADILVNVGLGILVLGVFEVCLFVVFSPILYQLDLPYMPSWLFVWSGALFLLSIPVPTPLTLPFLVLLLGFCVFVDATTGTRSMPKPGAGEGDTTE